MFRATEKDKNLNTEKKESFDCFKIEIFSCKLRWTLQVPT